jgi:hypothetical protein
MKFALVLVLTTFLCTCGSAQKYVGNLPKEACSVAFIKGETGFLIDSLTIRTSLDTVPYGFGFTEDTLIFDIAIFRPVDELILETFVNGHSFGQQRCWVDAPSADVYLSIASGRGIIDSVGLSPMNRWYRTEINKIRVAPNLFVAKRILVDAIYSSLDLLISADFLEMFSGLPNLNRGDVNLLTEVLRLEMGAVKKHPRFVPILARRKLMASNLPGKLSKYELVNASGEISEVPTPDIDYWVLNLYNSANETSRRDHELIQQTMETDSLFNNVPIISISEEEGQEKWSNYLKEGGFSWPHYREVLTKKTGLTEKASLYPGTTYLLLNQDDKIEGVYGDVVKLAAAIVYRKQSGMPSPK